MTVEVTVPPGFTSVVRTTLVGRVMGSAEPVIWGSIGPLIRLLPVGVAAPSTMHVAPTVAIVIVGAAASAEPFRYAGATSRETANNPAMAQVAIGRRRCTRRHDNWPNTSHPGK